MNMPIDLTEEDTAAPPLPPWLKGFLVTSKNSADVRRAGEEVSALCNDTYFKLANDDVGVPKSMEKPGETEVAYEKAESLLIPGCSGSVFVALRPDNNAVCPTRLAEGGWFPRVCHVQRKQHAVVVLALVCSHRSLLD